jgi:NADH:ubiquinone oxidoreductase subunit 4 (subunit M)
MLIVLLLLIPLTGVFLISIKTYPNKTNTIRDVDVVLDRTNRQLKSIALQTSICTLFVSLVIFALFDFSNNQFQFVQENHDISSFNFYLGVDGLSIYFVLLTTIIMPVSLLSN